MPALVAPFRVQKELDMGLELTPRQGALGFATLSYDVFPVHGINGGVCTCGDLECGSPGKHPFTKLAPHGHKDATGDVAKIRAWPSHINYGIPTDRFVVVDVDPRNGGNEAWQKLYRRPTRCLPHTWEVVTGSGGRHIFFANPTALKCQELTRGVDIKAAGGYVVGVGSKHISGKSYTWAPQCAPGQAELCDPPQWLLDELNNKNGCSKADTPRKPAAYWAGMISEPVCEGSRNDTFTRLAGHLIACGVDPLVAWTALICVNRVWFTPPEDEDKLSGIFNRLLDRECKKVGA
jgi:hypothetical protein